MENSTTETTPMGRVWLIVFFSICATLLLSALWHVSEMKKHERRYQTEDSVVIENIALITPYRDALKAGGMEGGAAYLATLSPENNGNPNE